jgi:hypothetical protein
MKMTNRERFKAIARFQRPGDLYTYDSFWPETLPKWVAQQGAPKELIPEEHTIYYGKFLKEYFKYSDKCIITQVKSAFIASEAVDLGYGIDSLGGSPLVPGFEMKIVAEDERSLTYINGAGQKLKAVKNKGSMPMFLDWPVKDRASWKELKKRLDPFTPERWPVNWEAYVKELNSQDDPVVLYIGGLYGFIRDWVGNENLLYLFHDDPVLVEEMMEHILYLESEIIKRVVKDIKVDEVDFLEDMAYKAGPLISPAMIRKFMLPRYKKITDLLHSQGIDIIFVDSDGNVEQIIPIWLEAGINYVWPLEQAAGNDAVALRKKYGKNLILSGAIDKRALIKGKEAIKAEVMSKVPYLLEQGGYFPSVDHSVPPDISFENYCYYINTLREVAGLEKLSF